MSCFKNMGLSNSLIKSIQRAGYKNPTLIQEKAIPLILSRKDIIASSQTGTGKTAAFLVPIINKINPNVSPQCLILEPTRELAIQVIEQARIFSFFKPINSVLLHGGVGYNKQVEDLGNKPDIIVATPGRLLDFLNKGGLDLSKLKFLVLDEVDRMLDMGFLPSVNEVIKFCPKNRQTLFFSATMPPLIESLSKGTLTNPVKVEIGKSLPNKTINHVFYPVGMDQRDDLLIHLINQLEFKNLIIFTKTKKEADSLILKIKLIDKSIPSILHSDISQKDRIKSLSDFRKGKSNVMIATDIAARGLDISNVTHVINYRVPENPEDYVHRIGRTGRANSEGEALTILTSDEIENAKSIENFINHSIERKKAENFSYNFSILFEPSQKKTIRKSFNRSKSRRR